MVDNTRKMGEGWFHSKKGERGIPLETGEGGYHLEKGEVMVTNFE